MCPDKVQAASVDAEDKTAYIVQVKDSESLEGISQKYQVQMDDECETDHLWVWLPILQWTLMLIKLEKR